MCVCIKGEVVALGAFTGAKYTHSFTGLKKKITLTQYSKNNIYFTFTVYTKCHIFIYSSICTYYTFYITRTK